MILITKIQDYTIKIITIKLKYLLFGIIFFVIKAQAQYKIEGVLNSKNKKLNWGVLYRLEEGVQQYVKNTKIRNKKFEFEIPANSKKGTYRVLYQLKEESFIDFIFNKENIKFSFEPNNAEETIIFEISEENKIYQSYLLSTKTQQKLIDSLQTIYFRQSNPKQKKLYISELKKLSQIQNDYEKISKGKLANHFIKASKRYNPDSIMNSPQKYLAHIIDNFFKYIDFNDEILSASSFLVNKTIDYVFYLNHSKDDKIQKKIYIEAISNVLKKPKKVTLQKNIINILIEKFAKQEDSYMVKYLFKNHYDLLPIEFQKEKFKKQTLSKMAVAVGANAPEIEWTEGEKSFKLSELNEARNYIIVFWSTGCPHCERQLPEMYQYLKNIEDVQVIAIALEKKAKPWKNLIPNFQGWKHILGLNKWKNEIAGEYKVSGTPSYFVLNADKVILAKPKNLINLMKVVNRLKKSSNSY